MKSRLSFPLVGYLFCWSYITCWNDTGILVASRLRRYTHITWGQSGSAKFKKTRARERISAQKTKRISNGDWAAGQRRNLMKTAEPNGPVPRSRGFAVLSWSIVLKEPKRRDTFHWFRVANRADKVLNPLSSERNPPHERSRWTRGIETSSKNETLTHSTGRWIQFQKIRCWTRKVALIKRNKERTRSEVDRVGCWGQYTEHFSGGGGGGRRTRHSRRQDKWRENEEKYPNCHDDRERMNETAFIQNEERASERVGERRRER